MSATVGFPRAAENRIVLLLLSAGVVVRIGWLALGGSLSKASGEAMNAAMSVARDGTVGDVFGRGSGLSAHINPLPPLFAGSIYRLFGTESLLAELILLAVALLVVMATGFLLYRVFARLGMPVQWRLAALAVFCLLPLNVQLETISFRVWEGALTALLGIAVLLIVVASPPEVLRRRRTFFLLSLLSSLAFFLTPAMGLATFAMQGLALVRHVPRRDWPTFGLIATATLAAVLLPWTIRNYEAFGRFIPLRSNAGLELSLGNHPEAMGAADDSAVFFRRLQDIHPQQSQAAFDRMRAAGDERVYADRLGDEARAWIGRNPADFAYLSAKYWLEFYFPPTWQWTIYTNGSKGTLIKQGLFWAISALSLIGAAASLLLWRGQYIYVAILMLFPSLQYAIVQPVLRYRYLIYAAQLYLAIEVARRAWAWLAARAEARQPSMPSLSRMKR